MTERGGRRRTRLTRLARILAISLAVAAIGLAALAVLALQRIDASLPKHEGRVVLAGLDAKVRVDRDELGVPTIYAETREDLARVTGFVHAQDRFVQMDFMRRNAAGELAEIVGATALGADQRRRRDRFRALARRTLAEASARQRDLIEAYAAGVNAGLAALGAPPPEYLLLRADPAPWAGEDCLLVLYAMFGLLQSEGSIETDRGIMREALPDSLYRFLTPAGDEWDAPLVGGALETPPPPGPEDVDLRGGDAREGRDDVALQPADIVAVGSNNWAVSGERSATGGALVANDMHLPLGVPNIWYRASLVLGRGGRGEMARRTTGVTLPGMPIVVAGSTGDIAWGFTNSQGDWSDVVLIEPDPKAPESRYLTPNGPREYEVFEERIEVARGEAEVVEVRWTIWGPIIDEDHHGRERVLRWVAHAEGGANLNLVDLEMARDVDEAIAVANRCGIPAQNFVVGDASGRIGWTIAGMIPRRFGHDGSLPSSWADGDRGWDGWLAPEEYPRVVDPPSGRIWTANARTVDGVWLDLLGDGGYAHGARAAQIRDALEEIETAGEEDLLAVALDDRALFLARWRGLILELLEDVAPGGGRASYRDHVREWGGRAATDSVGYRLVREFRRAVLREALVPLLAPCSELSEEFRGRGLRLEGPLWVLVTERPPHLLGSEWESWEGLLLSVIDQQIEAAEGAGGLAGWTWGARNVARFRHPLSRAVPVLGRWLDVPPRALPGDHNMPRVQTPGHGASERFVVSPSREAKGIMHMPCGQSGHFRSPHYRDQHDAWERGAATPFLPGESVSTLVLVPEDVAP